LDHEIPFVPRSVPVRRAVVAGAGAFGSAISLALARDGWRVSTFDPQPLARNASGIAAGMLAPAMEAALDPGSHGHYALLAGARDSWPAFAQDLGPMGMERCGALMRGGEVELDVVERALEGAGARYERVVGGLYTPEDWRIEPRLALAAMRKALLDHGGEVIAEALDWRHARVTEASVVVVATGYGRPWLIPEAAVLTPIKGQLLRYPEAGPRDGPILRIPGAYLAPGRDGAVVGATMQPDRDDLVIEPDAVARLEAQAARLAPELAGARASPLAGVRAATPDGLPLIGATSTPGVFLAAGARRNGWLLAPLAAQLIVEAVGGRTPGRLAADLSPGRFSIRG